MLNEHTDSCDAAGATRAGAASSVELYCSSDQEAVRGSRYSTPASPPSMPPAKARAKVTMPPCTSSIVTATASAPSSASASAAASTSFASLPTSRRARPRSATTRAPFPRSPGPATHRTTLIAAPAPSACSAVLRRRYADSGAWPRRPSTCTGAATAAATAATAATAAAATASTPSARAIMPSKSHVWSGSAVPSGSLSEDSHDVASWRSV
jgi:hypothetical protein